LYIAGEPSPVRSNVLCNRNLPNILYNAQLSVPGVVGACPRFVELLELGLALKEHEFCEDAIADERWYLPAVFQIGINCTKLRRVVLPSRAYHYIGSLSNLYLCLGGVHHFTGEVTGGEYRISQTAGVGDWLLINKGIDSIVTTWPLPISPRFQHLGKY